MTGHVFHVAYGATGHVFHVAWCDWTCIPCSMAQPGVTGVLCADQQGLALTGECGSISV